MVGHTSLSALILQFPRVLFAVLFAMLRRLCPFLSFFLGYRGIVHPPSDDGGTERTWFVPEHLPRKHFLSDQSKASEMSTLCQLVLTKIPDKCKMCETPALSR